MPISDFLDQMLIQHFLFETYTPPEYVYVFVSTTTPGQNGSNVTEPTDSAYARVKVPWGPSYWGAATNQPTSGFAAANLVTITFPTASVAWGTLTYGGLFDALTGGNFLGSGILTMSPPQPITINAGDTWQILPQGLIVQNN